ncbi:GTP-binding protein ypt2 [Pelomyxa schiedti]|nr:GTP-binding protein ypt2 [Pelomyxa schiedti]
MGVGASGSGTREPVTPIGGTGTQGNAHIAAAGPPPLLQIVMAGDARCGKSALVERLSVCGTIFIYSFIFPFSLEITMAVCLFYYQRDTFSGTYEATTGGNLVRHRLSDCDGSNPVNLQIWDCGEIRICLLASYFRNKSGALLVYDVRNTHSFDSIRKWHARLKESSPGAAAVLVGNMCDDEANRQIPSATGRQLASELHIPFIECSALTGDNVQAAFVQLTTAIRSGEQVEITSK